MLDPAIRARPPRGDLRNLTAEIRTLVEGEIAWAPGKAVRVVDRRGAVG